MDVHQDVNRVALGTIFLAFCIILVFSTISLSLFFFFLML